MMVDQQGQVFPVERVDIEQQSGTLACSEDQGNIFSSQCRVRVDGGRPSTAVPAQFIWLVEDVGDGCCRLKGG